MRKARGLLAHQLERYQQAMEVLQTHARDRDREVACLKEKWMHAESQGREALIVCRGGVKAQYDEMAARGVAAEKESRGLRIALNRADSEVSEWHLQVSREKHHSVQATLALKRHLNGLDDFAVSQGDHREHACAVPRK